MLILQDVFAIFLLILAATLGGDSPASAGPTLASVVGLAALKGTAAFLLAILLGRIAVRPLFAALSRAKSDEIFTATALLIVLATAAASGAAGLSLTLGAFLGGMMLSETPFRHLIRTEAKPFRDLLLAFFFISIGMSLDWRIILDNWGQILAFTTILVMVKGVAVGLSAKLVGWSTPGSMQLGSLLAQGSEFVFVILSMPAIRAAFGEEAVGVVFIGVAISLALTPSLADWGSRVARRIGRKSPESIPVSETTPLESPAAVLIFGMGAVGRTVADALEAHKIKYEAIENDYARLTAASVDGFREVSFGDVSDLRFAQTMSIDLRKVVVVTNARLQRAREVMPIVADRFPQLTLFASISDANSALEFTSLGMLPVVERGGVPGLELAEKVLAHQGVDEERIHTWSERRRQSLAAIAEAVAV